jgi:PHD/YefM family antitoxin component YafN of YafNO toxin-antitoxin module
LLLGVVSRRGGRTGRGLIIDYFIYFFYAGSMKYISDTEAKQDLGSILDAIQHEPVVIRAKKQDVAVVLSMEEYHHLTAVDREEFNDFCLEASQKARAAGLTAEIIA